MIPKDHIPRSGLLIIQVDFPIPVSPNAANDFRRTALKFAKVEGLLPLKYFLHDPRGATGQLTSKVGRSYAGGYEFGYSDMTPERFRSLKETIDGWRRFKWCDETDIMIADWVEIKPVSSPDAPDSPTTGAPT